MNRPIRLIGLLLLLLGVILAGCGTAETGMSLEETVQAAVEATVTARQEPPRPTQVSGIQIGPPAPEGTPTPKAQLPQGQVPRINVTELKAKVDAGEAIIVDARLVQSYAKKHIAGALSMPHNEVDARYTELPRDKEVVFYCT